ncbi:MAG: hypothetical protein EON91_06330 [Brevundimonas sp.]|nr:MAG: hypothetical protein EON91_06330 [Brevundimonas sp.]
MTGGLVIWALHFMGLYAIASAADVWGAPDAWPWRLAGAVFSVLCLMATIGVVLWLGRQRTNLSEPEGWERRVGLTGAVVAAVSIVWQTGPLAF